MSLEERVLKAIRAATGARADLAGSRMAPGGSINICRVITLEDGRRFFVKTHPQAERYPGMFAAEFVGLEKLAEPGVIRVPAPICYDEDFIVMEAIERGARKPGWQETIGRQLALLHHATQRQRYGFERDNYLGTTPQSNHWQERWLDFWREQRLGRQLEIYARHHDAGDPLLRLGEKLALKLADLIGPIDEPAVLLHGDLWSGNASADEAGNPVIYDPACYYGHREAEIGMMRMFGGFGPTCEAAYEEVWPLEAGANERIVLYTLYHELNHLNLFGPSYYQSCLLSLRRLL